MFSEGTSDSRGVAILFSDDLDYEILSKEIDNDGNYIILDLKVLSYRFSLAVVYGPNRDKPSFYHDLGENIKQFKNSSVVMVGDWNIPMDYNLDTKGYQHQNNPKARESLLQMIESMELFDIWRVRNEDVRSFTWFKNSKQMARLDYFLVTSDWVSRTLQTKITPGYRTDHSLLTLKLNIQTFPRGKGFWKFNASLLYDKAYVQLVKKAIEEAVERYKIPDGGSDSDNVKFSIDDQTFFEMLKLDIRGRTISYCTHLKKLREAQEDKLEHDIESLYEQMCQNFCSTNNLRVCPC